MVAADQLESIDSQLLVRVSSRDDATMLDRTGEIHDSTVLNHRRAFCQANGVEYEDVVYQRIEYGPDESYDRLVEVNEQMTTAYIADVAADGLFTSRPGVGLFLPVADCVATVLFDPKQKLLAVLHLGRHSTLTDLVPKTLTHFEQNGSDLVDLIVWMSPSAQRMTYRMDYFDYEDDPAWQPFFDKKSDGYYIDLQGFNQQRLLDAGVLAENITTSPINTMKSLDYFSHAAGDIHGRMAVLAMMR